jgi:hypothetical protein
MESPPVQTGVLLFAYNTPEVDYVKIADNTSRLIRHHLGLPVTLVTDSYSTKPEFDYQKIIHTDYVQPSNSRPWNGTTFQWKNRGRHHAYDLTPYDTTLLLDVDYLVLSDKLINLIITCDEYSLMSDSRDYVGILDNAMGVNALPFVWATAVVFRRRSKTRLLFDLIKRIEANYSYYSSLFNTDRESYRNDYVFAMADWILNGYALDRRHRQPYDMLTVSDPITAMEHRGEFVTVRHQDRAAVISRQDLHVMDKYYLYSDDFAEFVEQECQRG